MSMSSGVIHEMFFVILSFFLIPLAESDLEDCLARRGPESCVEPLRNHCASIPCLARAPCVPTFGGYFCRCPPDRYGKDCQHLTHRKNGLEFVQGVYGYYKTLPEINKTREFFISIVRPGKDFKMVVNISDDHRESEFYSKDLIYFNTRRYCMTDRYSDKKACMLIAEGELLTVRVVVSKTSWVMGGRREMGLGQRTGRLKEMTLKIYNGGLCSYSHSYNILVDIQATAMACLPRIHLHGCSLDRGSPTKVNKCSLPMISLISSTKNCMFMETYTEIVFKENDYIIQRTWTSSENIHFPDSLKIGKSYELQAFFYKTNGMHVLKYEEFIMNKAQCWFEIEECNLESVRRKYLFQHQRNFQSLPEQSESRRQKRSETVEPTQDEKIEESILRFAKDFWARRTKKPFELTSEEPITTEPVPSITSVEPVQTSLSEPGLSMITHVSPSNIPPEGQPSISTDLEDLLFFLETHPDDSRNLQTTKNLTVSLEETVYRVLQYLGEHTLDKTELRKTSGTMFKVIDKLMESQFAIPVNRSETEISSDELHFKMQEEETRSLNIMNHISTISVRLLKSIEPFEVLNFSTNHFETAVTMNTIANLTKNPVGDNQASVLIIDNNKPPSTLMKLVVTKYKDNLLKWSDTDPNSPLVQISTFIENNAVKDIPVELTMEVKPQKTEHSGMIQDSDHVEIHKFILFDNEPSWGLLNFKFKNFLSPLKVKCMLDEVPDLHVIKYSGVSINKSNTQFQFDASGGNYETIIYLGVSSEENLPSLNYSFEMTNGQCLIWGEGNWMDGTCKIKFDSMNGRLSCRCNHTSLFSSALFTPPHIVNPITDIYLFRTFLYNPFVGMLVMVFLMALVVLLIWGRYKDKKTRKNTAELLADSPMGKYPYLIGAYTGTAIRAGTTADVCIQIFGNKNQSLVHNLKSKEIKALQVGQDDWFLIYSQNSLGKIKSIQLFHNDMGSSPDWYCKKIVIYDITNRQTYLFEVSDWISILYLNDKGGIEKTFFPVDLKIHQPDKFRGNLSIGIRTNHNWLCIFTRHQRSPFTRCQMIMSSCTMLFFSMLLSMMFYGALEGKPEDFPAAGLKIADYIIALETFLIALPVTMILRFLFQRAVLIRMKREAGSIEEQIRKIDEGNDEKESKIKKVVRKHFTKGFKAFPLLPVTMAEKTTTTKIEHIWLAVAWTVAIVTIATCAFFMVLYSLKFGRYKSIQWLLTFFLGWSQDLILIQPFNVVLASILFAVFFHKVASVDRFYFKLGNLEKSRLRRSKAMQLRVHNPIYRPLTQDEVKIQLLRREKKEFYKWIFLRLCITLSLFILTIIIAVHRDVENQLIEVQYFRDLADGLGEMKNMYNEKGLIEFLRYAMPPFCSMSYEPEEGETKGICTKYSPRIVGLPRVRQQRVKPNMGTLSSCFKDIYTSADAQLSYSTEDTKSYMFGWSSDKKGVKSRDNWNYSNHIALQTTTMYGYTLTSYDGGGYTQELGYTQEDSRDKFFKLNRYKFIDTYTRAIFLEYNVYDPNSNVFIYVGLLAENFADGIYTVTLKISADIFGRRGDTIEFSFILVRSLFVALFLGLCIQIICDIPMIGLLSSLKNPKIIIDLLCILFGAMTLTYSLTRVLFFKLYMEGHLKQYGEHYVSFTYAMYESFMFKYSLGLFIVSLGLRLVFLFSDRITAIYFKGMLFLRPYTLFALFLVVAYFNAFFNIMVQYFGCPAFPGLITIIYDKITTIYYLHNTSVEAEYIIIVLYNYIFFLLRILFIAAAICYHRDSVYFLKEYLERNKLQSDKYFMYFKKLFTIKKLSKFKEEHLDRSSGKIPDFERERPIISENGELHEIFKDIHASMDLRQYKLMKMIVDINIILDYIDNEHKEET